MTLVAGVDDAGRGPIIGPLIIAGVLFRDDQLDVLHALGVRDSKLLSPNRREKLTAEIQETALKCVSVEVGPAEIDRVVTTGKKFHKLNFLEAKTMADVIKQLMPHIAYVDASDVLAERYGNLIKSMLPLEIKVISEHKADRTYPVVSAASIIAKVRRDTIIAGLRRRYGDFGSGYVTDPRAINFLREWLRKYGSYPDFVRKSWKTAKRLMEEMRQTHL